MSTGTAPPLSTSPKWDSRNQGFIPPTRLNQLRKESTERIPEFRHSDYNGTSPSLNVNHAANSSPGRSTSPLSRQLDSEPGAYLTGASTATAPSGSGISNSITNSLSLSNLHLGSSQPAPTPTTKQHAHSRTTSLLSSFGVRPKQSNSPVPQTTNSNSNLGGQETQLGFRQNQHQQPATFAGRTQTSDSFGRSGVDELGRSSQNNNVATIATMSEPRRSMSITSPGPSQSPNMGKPTSPSAAAADAALNANPEIRSVVNLTVAHARKVYFSGKLVRRVERQPDGNRPAKDEGWRNVWAQLGGTTLSVWDMAEIEEASKKGKEVPPTYINVTDAFVQVLGSVTIPATATTPAKKYTNVVTLNTAGSNLMLFACPSTADIVSWAAALRLSAWEKSRLEEIYTAHLTRLFICENNQDPRSPLVKGKMEGWVRIRLAGQTDWKRLWLIVHGGSGGSHHNGDATDPSIGDRPSSPAAPRKNRMSNLFSRPHTPPTPSTPHRPLLTLYNSPKSKDRKKPVLTISDVAQAFAVYPEKPELITRSTLFKIEGLMGEEEIVGNMKSREAWTLVMPEVDTSRLGSLEMLKWLVGIHDAFSLYGRPQGYSWDPREPLSMMFAYPVAPNRERLFLDREQAEKLDPRDDRTNSVRAGLLKILVENMHSQPSPVANQDVQRAPPVGGDPKAGAVNDKAGSLSKLHESPAEMPSSLPQLPPLSFDSDPSANATSANGEGNDLDMGLSTSGITPRRTSLSPITERSTTRENSLDHHSSKGKGTGPGSGGSFGKSLSGDKVVPPLPEEPSSPKPTATSPIRTNSTSILGINRTTSPPSGTTHRQSPTQHHQAPSQQTHHSAHTQASTSSSAVGGAAGAVRNPLSPQTSTSQSQYSQESWRQTSIGAGGSVVPSSGIPSRSSSYMNSGAVPASMSRGMSVSSAVSEGGEEKESPINLPLSILSTPAPEYALPASNASQATQTPRQMSASPPQHLHQHQQPEQPLSPTQLQSPHRLSSEQGSPKRPLSVLTSPFSHEGGHSPQRNSMMGMGRMSQESLHSQSPTTMRAPPTPTARSVGSGRFSPGLVHGQGPSSSPSLRPLSVASISQVPGSPLARVANTSESDNLADSPGARFMMQQQQQPQALFSPRHQTPSGARVIPPRMRGNPPPPPSSEENNDDDDEEEEEEDEEDEDEEGGSGLWSPKPDVSAATTPFSSPPPPPPAVGGSSSGISGYGPGGTEHGGSAAAYDALTPTHLSARGGGIAVSAPGLVRKPSGARAAPGPGPGRRGAGGNGNAPLAASHGVDHQQQNRLATFSSSSSQFLDPSSPSSSSSYPMHLQNQSSSANAGVVSPQPVSAEKAQPRTSYDDDDEPDSALLAALSYLDQQEEQAEAARNAALTQSNTTTSPPPPLPQIIEPPGASASTQLRSSFAPTKQVADRKARIQAQQAAHEAAAHKPGRPNGKPKTKPRDRGAWQDSSEEEDEDEEDEDDEDEDEEGDADSGRRQNGSGLGHANNGQVSASSTFGRQSNRVGSPSNSASEGNLNSQRPPRTLPQIPRGRSPAAGDIQGTAQQRRFVSDQYRDNSNSRRTLNEDAAASSGQWSAARNQADFAAPGAARQNVWSAVLDPNKGNLGPEATNGRDTFVQLESQSDQITKTFAPQGLLSAGLQDKQDRSAKRQEELARESGGSLINVPHKPPPPQTGLLGAITGYERERKREGGVGAALTEREREKRQAEERQRRLDEMQRQQLESQQNMAQYGMYGLSPQMTGFNPMMGGAMNPYQQSMFMNPMFGNPMGFNPQHMYAAQQAAQAYQQAMLSMSAAGSQIGEDDGQGGVNGAGRASMHMGGGQSPAPSPGGMMGFDPRMSMMGMGMGMMPGMGMGNMGSMGSMGSMGMGGMGMGMGMGMSPMSPLGMQMTGGSLSPGLDPRFSMAGGPNSGGLMPPTDYGFSHNAGATPGSGGGNTPRSGYSGSPGRGGSPAGNEGTGAGEHRA